jgi:hypothetical protein
VGSELGELLPNSHRLWTVNRRVTDSSPTGGGWRHWEGHRRESCRERLDGSPGAYQAQLHDAEYNALGDPGCRSADDHSAVDALKIRAGQDVPVVDTQRYACGN